MKVVLDAIESAKIDYWTAKCPKEIGGLGLIKIVGDEIHVTKVFLLEQEVTGSETELSDEATVKLMAEAMTPENMQKGTLNFWWHSHVNMGTTWSGTDHNTMEKLGKRGYFLSMVLNKSGSRRCCYTQGAVGHYPMLKIDDLPITITNLLDASVTSQLDAEYNAKVKERVYATQYPMHNGGHGGGRKGWVTTEKKADGYREVSGYFSGWDDDFSSIDDNFYDHQGNFHGNGPTKASEEAKVVEMASRWDKQHRGVFDEQYFHSIAGKNRKNNKGKK
jgi:hypothetical protein